MARLPVDASDTDIWGSLINAYLLTEHNTDGTHPVLYDRGGTVYNSAGYASVAAAVTAGGAGSVVFVRPGTHTESPFSLAANQTLKLAPGATLKLANGSNADFITIPSAAGASIEGGTIDGNKANQTGFHAAVVVNASDNVLLDRVHIKDARGIGLYLYQSNNVTLDRSIIENSGVSGQATDGTGANIYISGGDGIHITKNRLMTGEDSSIHCAANTGIRNLSIKDNIISGAHFLGIATGGGLSNTQEVTITGNHITSCVNNGIDFGNSQQVMIANNRVKGCGGGIVGDTSSLTGTHANHSNVVIEGNIITGCTDAASYGIAVIGFTSVINNHVSGGAAAGILLGPGPTTALRTALRVSGNVCWNNTNYGIHLVAGATDVVSDVFITENRCYDDQTIKTQYYGLAFYIVSGGSVDYVKIINNNFRGNTVSSTLTESTGTVGANVTNSGNF